jgi:transposase
VSKAHRYDPDINPTYHNFAVHYGFGVLPARPYKPRDSRFNYRSGRMTPY